MAVNGGGSTVGLGGSGLATHLSLWTKASSHHGEETGGGSRRGNHPQTNNAQQNSNLESLGNCLRAQFAWAKNASAESSRRNAYSIRPSANTLVSAGIAFLAGWAWRGPSGALALGAAVGVGRGVLADNIVRTARSVSDTWNINGELEKRLLKCYRDHGQTPPPGILSSGLADVYGR